MALRLRLTGEHAARLGEQATRVFGVHGGRIGRAADNDWPLPDPERFLSGHHATVAYRGGVWYVVDTSSNGTFLNEAPAPIGRDQSRPLMSGDRLRMGAYEFEVNVSPDNDFAPDTYSTVAPEAPGEADIALATHGDLGAELDIERLLADPNPPPDDPPQAAPVTPAPSAAARAPDAYGETAGQRRAPAPKRPAVRPVIPPPPTDTSASLSAPVQAFCRGAGIDPATVAASQASAVLALAGQLLREMALGLMSCLQHRAEHKGRYGVGDTALSRVEHNVFKVSGSVEDALARLFAARSGRFLAPLEAVRLGFSDLSRHEQAMVVATQDALSEYLRRLAPESLEQQFRASLARNGAPPPNPGEKYWELYAGFYKVLAQSTAEGWPRAFAEEFAKAYETANEELRERTRRPSEPPDPSRESR